VDEIAAHFAFLQHCKRQPLLPANRRLARAAVLRVNGQRFIHARKSRGVFAFACNSAIDFTKSRLQHLYASDSINRSVVRRLAICCEKNGLPQGIMKQSSVLFTLLIGAAASLLAVAIQTPVQTSRLSAVICLVVIVICVTLSLISLWWNHRQLRALGIER
jgi:hypothetical protein